jgi:hypothetical protein
VLCQCSFLGECDEISLCAAQVMLGLLERSSKECMARKRWVVGIAVQMAASGVLPCTQRKVFALIDSDGRLFLTALMECDS